MFAVTAVSGFPKPGYNGYNIDNILKGQIGDDAYFVARHVDEWGSGEREGTPEPLRENATQGKIRGNADVIGVADGVGGWRQYGVDPGLFSNHLMRSCERLVQAGFFQSNTPSKLLEQVRPDVLCKTETVLPFSYSLPQGFREMQENKQQIVGSSTACLMMLCHSDLKLYTANIGDSGFLVVRCGEVVHRSQEQQHYFNTPFQLSLPPTELQSEVSYGIQTKGNKIRPLNMADQPNRCSLLILPCLLNVTCNTAR